MCLNLSRKSYFKIARKDIVVSKLLYKRNNKLMSCIYNKHEWKPNETYKSEIRITRNRNWIYDKLFVIDKNDVNRWKYFKVFSYNLVLQFIFLFKIKHNDILTIEDGYHSYADPNYEPNLSSWETDYTVFKKFIIPKGTLYIKGNFDCESVEVVSNQLIMLEDDYK